MHTHSLDVYPMIYVMPIHRTLPMIALFGEEHSSLSIYNSMNALYM